MERSEVEALFAQLKWRYIGSKEASDEPIVFILGGQPSSGKGSLAKIAQSECPDLLVINGDKYREHHPGHSELLKDPLSYSEETQIFSNVFTEGLIGEATQKRLTVSVEGTMRRSEVVANTARKFKDAGFRVELMCIAAPPEFTAVNLFSRYAGEVKVSGAGRLADFDSHNQACEGLLKTLDDAYKNTDIDRIRIYEIFGLKLVADYQRNTIKDWNISVHPSDIVQKSRLNQLSNSDLAFLMIEKGVNALAVIQESEIRGELIKHIGHLLQGLSSKYQSTDLSSSIQENNLLDEIDRLTYGVSFFKQNGIDTLWNECKVYNSNPLFERERKHTGLITISQASKMALDGRPIKTSKVILDVAYKEDMPYLKVNGIPIRELIDRDNSLTVGKKR